MNKTTIIVIFIVLIVGAFGGAIFIKNKPITLVSNNQVLPIATGKQLYQQNCASCHGANLEGQPNWRSANTDGSFSAPPHDETGHTWHHDDETLFSYTKLGGKGIAKLLGYENPNSGMPAYEDSLSDAEIVAILNYIKSTWPQKIRDIQSARNTK